MQRLRGQLMVMVALILTAGCGGGISSAPDAGSVAGANDAGADPSGRGADGGAPDSSTGRPSIFVIAMENHSSTAIYGSASAPYINGTLMAGYARALSFEDELPGVISEPHYVWLEAGTNAFADHTFTSDLSPSADNSTAGSAHLATQIRDAGGGLDWRSYQEGISDDVSGRCPIHADGLYVPRHDPFLFFQDVVGSPPSTTNDYCAGHHRPLAALAGDLAAHTVAEYNFITPNLCHNMHGNDLCGGDQVRRGDDWLRDAMPALIAFVNANGGVVFITWDEGSPLPFLAVGPQVKRGYAGQVRYDHGSILRTVEELLGLPILPSVASTADLADLFTLGFLPASQAPSAGR